MIGAHLPYLAGNLVALPLLALAYLAAGPQRGAMLASGALCAPLGMLSLVMGDYWSPARLGGLPLGIEDFLFSFQAGASAWFWGSLPFRNRLVVDLRWRLTSTRAAAITTAFLAGLTTLWATGVSGLLPTFLASPAIIAVALAWCPALWRLAMATSIGFAGTYVVLLWALLALMPGLAGEWPAGKALTMPVLSLPLGEYIWALVGAPAHVLTFAYVARARFVDPAWVREGE